VRGVIRIAAAAGIRLEQTNARGLDLVVPA
jgi:hypothetical protein